jgi:hypothetical protein
MRVAQSQFEAAAPAPETSSGVLLPFDFGPGPIDAGIRCADAASNLWVSVSRDQLDEIVLPLYGTKSSQQTEKTWVRRTLPAEWPGSNRQK